MLVGAGALHATDELVEVAELLGAGVAKALLGKAARARRSAVRHRLDRPARHRAELGDDERLRHAADGRLGVSRIPSSCRRKARRAACRSTSTARMLSLRYPMEVSLVGDSAETLRALIPLLAAQDRSPVARAASRRTSRSGGRCSRRARWRRRSRSTRSACSGSCRRACPTRDPHLRLGLAPPTGMRAT